MDQQQPPREYMGPLQPSKSRLPVSKVWSMTTRPGPASYRLGGGFGKQADSTKPKFPYMHFGSEPRTNTVMEASYSKGPIYQHSVSMGKQAESHRPTVPRAHFGTSSRDSYSALYTAFSYKPR